MMIVDLPRTRPDPGMGTATVRGALRFDAYVTAGGACSSGAGCIRMTRPSAFAVAPSVHSTPRAIVVRCLTTRAFSERPVFMDAPKANGVPRRARQKGTGTDGVFRFRHARMRL